VVTCRTQNLIQAVYIDASYRSHALLSKSPLTGHGGDVLRSDYVGWDSSSRLWRGQEAYWGKIHGGKSVLSIHVARGEFGEITGGEIKITRFYCICKSEEFLTCQWFYAVYERIVITQMVTWSWLRMVKLCWRRLPTHTLLNGPRRLIQMMSYRRFASTTKASRYVVITVVVIVISLIIVTISLISSSRAQHSTIFHSNLFVAFSALLPLAGHYKWLPAWKKLSVLTAKGHGRCN